MSVGKILLSIIKGILMFFGVIFIILVVVVAYLVIADPFDLKKYFVFFSHPPVVSSESSQTSETYDNPLLTNEQEQTLRNIGIDPASLPTEITPEMEACFTRALGEDRVKEVVAGATPTPLELLKAKSCL